jgi:hypothetical protein
VLAAILALALVAGVGPVARAQPAGALSLIGRAPISGRVGDLAVAGGFAYVTVWEGLRIVDLGDPVAPREIARHDPGGSGYAGFIAAEGDYVYLGMTQGNYCSTPPNCPMHPDNGLRVVDVSAPTAPRDAGFLNTPIWMGELAVRDRRVFLAETNGMRVVDATDPNNPRTVGLFTKESQYLYALALDGAYAYASGGGRLHVFDVADPARPAPIASTAVANALDVTINGGVAYVASGESTGLQTVDVADPGAPRLVAWQPQPGYASGVAVDGMYAYLASGGGGLQVLALCDRRRPHLVATYAVPPASDPSLPAMAVRVAVSGDLVYLLTTPGELQVLRFTPPAMPCRQAVPLLDK